MFGSNELWIALGGALAGGLLAYVGKSRELRLLTIGELRRLYAEYMSCREAYFYALAQYRRTRRLLSNYREEQIGSLEDEALEALPSRERKAYTKLGRTHQMAHAEAQAERRRYVLSLRQIQIQAPNDTYAAANLSSGLGPRLFKDDVEDIPTEAFEMFVQLARRDLTPYRSMWLIRERRADKVKKANWWKEATDL